MEATRLDREVKTKAELCSLCNLLQQMLSQLESGQCLVVTTPQDERWITNLHMVVAFYQDHWDTFNKGGEIQVVIRVGEPQLV